MAFPLRAFTMATLLGASTLVWGTPGMLDATFGTGGIVVTAGPNDKASAATIQPDGKVLTAGFSNNGTNDDVALTRYNADGTLDTGFGTGGTVTTPIGTADDQATAITLQPDGKVLVAGFSNNGINNDVALVRYNADGSLDTAFGTNGIVTTPIGTGSGATAIALQPDGKVLTAGYANNGLVYDFALVRYNADGSPDTSFGTRGIVTTSLGYGSQVNAIALQPDGKVLAAGQTNNGLNYEFALTRYNADGSLDTSFGSGGRVITSMGVGDAGANAVTLQSDGKVLTAGYSNNALNNYEFALVRYNADGSLDTGFASGGIVTTKVFPITSADIAHAVAIEPDGKVLAAGTVGGSPGKGYFALVRYNADGSLDTAFGTNGSVTTQVRSWGKAGALALQPDGKAVVAGFSYGGLLLTDFDFSLARYVTTDTAWDLTPDAISFTGQSDVASGSAASSDTATVSGLDAGIAVPLQVNGGSYSLNGGAYTTAMGWVRNGDTLAVRHTASSSPSTATSTTLTIGGMVAANNANVTLGSPVIATFSSTTAVASSASGSANGSSDSASGSSDSASGSSASGSGSSGGGAFSLAALWLLGLFGAFRRLAVSSV